jgi:hypothetical protein
MRFTRASSSSKSLTEAGGGEEATEVAEGTEGKSRSAGAGDKSGAVDRERILVPDCCTLDVGGTDGAKRGSGVRADMLLKRASYSAINEAGGDCTGETCTGGTVGGGGAATVLTVDGGEGSRRSGIRAECCGMGPGASNKSESEPSQRCSAFFRPFLSWGGGGWGWKVHTSNRCRRTWRRCHFSCHSLCAS